ncbi:inactive protein RESTRICTED TEV MOVEMENT 2-like [Quillaja saponaria]|uniref:Inactive protein RESTRICTED TEV MOVEMENT 2-like n=1 Tax=Quillaja saponaria TaxID=32244 RepID=A0AAD7L0Y1_QUISA|nr:inactive protein RESTRICTED TEV MOVEMENT 2-like [Quillaja saponaria]
MAMSQRSSGITRLRPAVRPVYEDFQPKSETKEDHESHYVHVQLPGFTKERIRITYVHSTRIVRVLGERPLENNRWSRFNQVYPVPENCDVDKIHGKFEQGVLTLRLPKKIISKVRPKEEVKAKQEAPSTSKPAPAAELPKSEKVQKEVIPPRTDIKDGKAPPVSSPPKPKAELTKPEKVQKEERSAKPISRVGDKEQRGEKIHPPSSPPKPNAALTNLEKDQNIPRFDHIDRRDKKAPPLSSPQKPNADLEVQKGQQDTKTKASTSAFDGQKKAIDKGLEALVPPKTTDEPEPQKGPHEIPQITNVTTDGKKQISEKQEANGKHFESRKLQKAEEKKPTEESKESASVKKTSEKEKDKSDANVEGNDLIDAKGKGIKEVTSSASEVVIRLAKRMNDEEKQTLVNMSAAILVIFGLGAYVSYKFSNSGKPGN